ncbi:hypothetical protein AX16_001125 [Volvariella volvacea WC 439]|nr:hypothetical protein AX16_001125 [Volvariella volvacea WC 439]
MSQAPKSSFAASRRVNAPGITPRLTEGQVWKGLGIKARQPQSFINAIVNCEVVEDQGDKLVRSVQFKHAPERVVREEVSLHGNTIAYFEIPSDNVRITNVLSYDWEDELVLTFSFTGGVPGTRADQPAKEINAIVGQAVEHTIQRLRELAELGEL